jgi:hypothetical protein
MLDREGEQIGVHGVSSATREVPCRMTGIDPIIRNQAELLAHFGRSSMDDLAGMVEDDVEPIYVTIDEDETSKGFVFSLNGTGMSMTYPFTEAEFWTEVHDAEESSLISSALFGLVSAAEEEEADGKGHKIQMIDLFDAAQLIQADRTHMTQVELGTIADHLADYGLRASRLSTGLMSSVVIHTIDFRTGSRPRKRRRGSRATRS